VGDLLGVVVLDVAEGPESDDGEQCEDSPAASAEGFFLGTYFGVDEAEERGSDEREQQRGEHNRLKDEDEGTLVPVRVEGEEGAEAVVVGPVEQEVAEESNEAEAPEE